VTPTVTPSNVAYYAYILPEPSDVNSAANIGQYMTDQNTNAFYGYWNSGGPPASNGFYSSDLDKYIHFSGWTTPVDEFITPVTNFAGQIRQASGAGVDSYGCTQQQYTFNSVPITTSQIDPTVPYFYSIWIPLNGVGGSLTNMTLDIGYGAACSTTVSGGGTTPDATLAGIDVTVTSGAAIPAGTYRVLWAGLSLQQPTTPPSTSTLWIKGKQKT
jgi:hypothetical protein